MELLVSGLAKSFGTFELFHDVSFRVASGERAGLVGANGAGKTTLMRCVTGAEERDAGDVRFGAATFGYLEQESKLGAGTLREEFLNAFSDIAALGEKKARLEREIASGGEAMTDYERVVERFEAAGGYDFESRMRKVAFGLGFTDAELAGGVSHLSGGQKTRVALAKALLRSPDFLFLDEPTNHLDINHVEWLEEFLKSYPGGVVVISHDRFFLDRVATKIVDLENGSATVYGGNYSYFQKVKSARRASLEAAYEKQQEHIRKTEEYIRRYKAGIKSKQARGRQSQLNRLERIVLPPETARFDYFAFNPPAECAERVAEIDEAAISFGGREIFSGASMLIRRGDGVALTGENGAGKTTLLRMIVGEISPEKGSVKIGSRVKIGYFSQHHEGLHKERTVLDEILYEYGFDENTARKYLGAFLFRGDEVYRVIGELSGGESARLAFLKLMLTGANFLVLDEPTNHLDIPAREAVEEALMAFPGTFIVVSHDRFFLDKVANRTFAMESGRLAGYDGNYSYYREKKAEREKELLENSAKKFSSGGKNPVVNESGGKKERTEKNSSKKTETWAAKNEEAVARAEARIAMAEAELKLIEHEMNSTDIQGDAEKSRKIAEDYAAKEREIEKLYEEWDAISG